MQSNLEMLQIKKTAVEIKNRMHEVDLRETDVKNSKEVIAYPNPVSVPSLPPRSKPIAAPAKKLIPVCEDLPTDFELIHLSPDFKVGNSCTLIADTKARYQETVNVNQTDLLCTPASKQEWFQVFSNDECLNKFSQDAMKICRQALDILCPQKTCGLQFYVADDSTAPQGFTTKDGEIYINFRTLMLYASKNRSPSFRAMVAYYASLMSHEFAHYLKFDDNHSPEHGRRTELNFES